MKTEENKYVVRHRWLHLLLGILFIGVGFRMMFVPGVGFVALAIVFSVCMFISGIFKIVFSIVNRKSLPDWGWYLAGGIIGLLFGALLISRPVLTMVMIPVILAFWFMFQGIYAIGISIDLNRSGCNKWGWNLAFGILSIVCSILILFQPATGAVISVYIAAFAFIFYGIEKIILSFELKNLKDNNQELKEQLEQQPD